MTIPPLPLPGHPVIDPETGLMNEVWFRYFRALDRAVRELLEA